jgi:hypothetical protein
VTASVAAAVATPAAPAAAPAAAAAAPFGMPSLDPSISVATVVAVVVTVVAEAVARVVAAMQTPAESMGAYVLATSWIMSLGGGGWCWEYCDSDFVAHSLVISSFVSCGGVWQYQ